MTSLKVRTIAAHQQLFTDKIQIEFSIKYKYLKYGRGIPLYFLTISLLHVYLLYRYNEYIPYMMCTVEICSLVPEFLVWVRYCSW